MLKCPKCGSEKIVVYVKPEAKEEIAYHSLLWWILIGWWYKLFKWLDKGLPRLIGKLFIPKSLRTQKKDNGTAVCQECGQRWEI